MNMNFVLIIEIKISIIYFQRNLKYNVRYVESLCYWYYNDETPEDSEWVLIPLSDYAAVGALTKDYSENSITFEFNVNIEGSFVHMLALSYNPPPSAAPPAGDGDGDDDKEAAPIPGYDIYILLLILSLISTIVIIQRRKKIRF